ncbi:MAG TPA: CpsD/CapB family tyrosine-protein kinase, partial [Acidimicrobiia bacterium]|nr:CpsD/CapB family tyrosine-protein kinase [Acidimicrobiia bacterium]
DVADRIGRVRSSLRGSPVGAQAAADSLLQEAAPFQDELASVNNVDVAAVGTVVQPATLPAAPAGPGPLSAAGIGALLGLAAGLGTAALRSRVDRRLRSHGDLETQLGAPVLADIPRTRREGYGEDSLVTLAVPDGPAAEAYRRLRTRLLLMCERWGVKTVMVASPSAGNGSTAIAANLAVSMAAAGRRVSLVAADLRTPFLHRYFGLDNDQGLSTVLTGEAAPADVAYAPPGLETLQVLPAGPALAEPTGLLESGPMRVVLDERCEVADVVVVEAPPALSHSESLTLAPMVDAIVVVADARHATRAELAEVGDQFRQVGGNVVGAVLCNLRP